MINLSGLEYKDTNNPNGDIEIEITGLKDGEKISEELFYNEEIKNTDHPKILKATANFLNLDKTEEEVELIKSLIEKGDQNGVVNLLKKICE